ncbi:MAG TPA: hypothetical protein VKG05_02620 [Steroidobacteraceae bacterium]|nr:hypothetical protein [Steroidobacteraceae bacterium]
MDHRSRWTPLSLGLLVAASLCVGVPRPCHAADQFSFSKSSEADQTNAQQDAALETETIQALVSVPCRERLKNHKILLLIGEQHADQWLTDQDRYGDLFRVIDARLRGLGLKTYTQQQIKASIAQAELDAYFKNDPDAALAASKKLGANYVLRGDITSLAGINPIVRVNEVSINIELTLSSINGRMLSSVEAHSESYSGSDTLHTALAMMRERADPLVAQLYNDFCRGGAGASRN